MFFAFLGLAGSWQNVALHTNGSTCTANSSDVGQPCLRAIDGLLWYNKARVSGSAGVGIGIEVWTILRPIQNGYADGPPFPTEINCVYIMDKLLHHWISEGSNTNQVPTFCRSHSKICKYKPWFCEMLFIIYCSTPKQIFTNSLFAYDMHQLRPKTWLLGPYLSIVTVQMPHLQPLEHVQPPVSERTSVAKIYYNFRCQISSIIFNGLFLVNQIWNPSSLVQ